MEVEEFGICVCEPVLAEALYVYTFAVRTTLKLLPYAKKLAAVKNDTAEFASGSPNVFLRVISLSTNTTLLAGPHENVPAKAPAVVRTDGTTVVKSISDTFTPGES